jgi:hypothetical protein
MNTTSAFSTLQSKLQKKVYWNLILRNLVYKSTYNRKKNNFFNFLVEFLNRRFFEKWSIYILKFVKSNFKKLCVLDLFKKSYLRKTFLKNLKVSGLIIKKWRDKSEKWDWTIIDFFPFSDPWAKRWRYIFFWKIILLSI